MFGISESLSKVTGSIGKGLSVLTMDSKFQKGRQLASRNRPKHVGHGVAKGAVSLAKGITSGVTGIITQPFEGARHGGFEGFFTGVGKGLLGIVAKPVVGIVDFASNVTEGIKNTTTVFEEEIDRQRLPRFIGKDGIIKPYSLREALGVYWLKSVENETYASQVYICHLDMRMDDLAAILTERRVIMIVISKLRVDYDVTFDGNTVNRYQENRNEWN